MYNVQTSLLPFDRYISRSVEVPEGLTVSEIINQIKPPEYGEITAYVSLNGDVVPENYWRVLRPKNSAILCIEIVPSGGGGGKNPLATVISIVAIVAAPYLAATYGAALGASLNAGLGLGMTSATSITALGGAVISGAVSLAASLAVSALSSVPKQSGGSTSTDVRDSPTLFIEGATNAIDPWGVVPVNLGRNRMYPKQAALPYTETQNNDQYVRQLFTYGFGKVALSESKIGETLISEFEGVSIDEKLDGDLSDGTSIYANDVFQENFGIKILQTDGHVLRTTQQNIDEFEVDITFPEGVFQYSSNGNRISLTISFNISYAPTGTTDWTTQNYTITENYTAALRRRYRFTVSNGQYDVRVQRTTQDWEVVEVKDDMVWTALRSVSLTNPVIQDHVSGKGVRIKASEQLSGTVGKLNEIVETYCLVYDPDSDSWGEGLSSNPADIFRYVLQSEGFVKRLPDSRIDLEKLAEWWVYCDSLGLEYNDIIDAERSVEDVLNDVAAAGFASKHAVEGVYGVIIDNEKPVIKGIVTPRNSWGYRGTLNYPEIPHGLRVEFRNKDKGYAMDERIIYRSGYNESNATLYQRIQFRSCTNADLAYLYGRRYLANAELQPEIHTFNQDVEAISYNRGDRITFINDSILVGVGQGRIESLVYDDDESPTEITGFVLDETVTIPSADNFAVRIRYNDASDFAYHMLTTTIGETDTFTFSTPISYSTENVEKLVDEDGTGALCSFVEDGKELDLIIVEMRARENHNIQITAIDYAPERFNIDKEPIPDFTSNVTNPLSSYRPVAPVLAANPQSNEDVMIANIDGSYTSRMIFPLDNSNPDPVQPLIKVRRSGSNVWFRPQILSNNPEEIIITGLDDGILYDFDLFYQKLNGVGLVSSPLQLRNERFIGGSTPPADVSGFKITVSDDNNAILKWTRNTEIDISHYEIRYSSLYSGAAWGTSQVLEEKAINSPLPIVFRGGTYLIKAVDYSGNYSDNATTVVTFNPGNIRNVVEELQEDGEFTGVKDNTRVENDLLYLSDTSEVGYYYFSDAVDVGAVATSFISAEIVANGVFVNDLFAIDDLFAEDDLFASGGSLDLFAEDDLFAVEDLFGIGTDAWLVELEFRTTNDDPDGSPTWTEWVSLTTGYHQFRAVEFRLVMTSLQGGVAPRVSTLKVVVDMPDRREEGEDLTVPVSGASITWEYAFQAIPAVNITVQDGADDDKITDLVKTTSGFSFKVYNKTVAGYVERTFDYIAAGYGRQT